VANHAPFNALTDFINQNSAINNMVPAFTP
jgi:hypothetical protein